MRIIKTGIFFAFVLTSLLLNSSCSKDTMDSSDDQKYMSFEMNGEKFNGLKPSFVFEGSPITKIWEIDNDLRYLWLQGGKDGYELNIRISNDFWKTGIVPMASEGFPSTHGAFASFINLNDLYSDDYQMSGEINITEFDLDKRKFKAEFTYADDELNIIGTLDYDLDHEYFD